MSYDLFIRPSRQTPPESAQLPLLAALALIERQPGVRQTGEKPHYEFEDPTVGTVQVLSSAKEMPFGRFNWPLNSAAPSHPSCGVSVLAWLTN